MDDPLNREELLSALFSEPHALRATSLHRALAALRNTRRRRTTRRIALAATAFIIGTLCIVGKHETKTTKGSPLISSVTPVETPRGIRILTDDELLDLFPGRAVALIGPVGNRRLVLLDAIQSAPRSE